MILLITISLCLSACAGFDTRPDALPPGADYEKLGTVSASQTNWNWLFLMSADERLSALEKLALNKAESEYGDDIIVVTENADGKWNPASLLMLFNTIGFVEDSTIEMSVWRKRPVPKIEATPVKYGYRYVVVPAADYKGDWGFMQVEYKTREQLESSLAEQLESGEIDETNYNKRISKLPDTGKIFITLAREEITNAISRWFTFTCTWNGKTIFRKRGVEDIPYVYGTDKLWWNDMSYNVGPAWDGELLLNINDSYRDEVFSFKVIKEKYIIEE